MKIGNRGRILCDALSVGNWGHFCNYLLGVGIPAIKNREWAFQQLFLEKGHFSNYFPKKGHFCLFTLFFSKSVNVFSSGIDRLFSFSHKLTAIR